MNDVRFLSRLGKTTFCFLIIITFLLSSGPILSASVNEWESLEVESSTEETVSSENLVASEGISPQAWSSMKELMELAEYQVTWQVQDGQWAYRAPNQAHGLDLAFAQEGFTLRRNAPNGELQWDFGMSLLAYGDQVMPSFIDRLNLKGNLQRVEYHWADSLVEWFENSPEGVEHGLTLKKPPESGGVKLTFALSGSLHPELDETGGGIRLRDEVGYVALQYDELRVFDSTERMLSAHMALSCDQPRRKCNMEISVVANSAVYPVTIDPRFHSESNILHASDMDDTVFFGSSVDISGDTAVIGAPWSEGCGAAYVFTRNQGGADSWAQVKRLVASDATAGDDFGSSVAIDGEVIVVGSPVAESTGAAYVYHRNQGGADQWGQVAKLKSIDIDIYDYFGNSVAVDSGFIVVGAVGEDGGIGDPTPDAGAAYVFRRNMGGMDNWGQQRKLSAIDFETIDNFGRSVAISEDIITVGAYLEDGGDGDPCENCGSVYLYHRNQPFMDNWGFLTKLYSSTLRDFDYFGFSVATNGEIVVAGAPTGDLGGYAEVFAKNQGGADHWGRVKKLTASDAQSGDDFGRSVAVSEALMVVGADEEDDGGVEAGAVYVFYRNQGVKDNWGEIRKITASDSQENDLFGSSAAVDNEIILIGASQEDGGEGDPYPNSGAAYIFTGFGAWKQVSVRQSSDIKEGDYFGYALSLSGDTLVVGAPYEDGGVGDPKSASGAAYVFSRNQGGAADLWGQVRTLRASDAEADDHFGISVGISGEVIIVGARFEDGGAGDPASNAGAAYIFARNQGGLNNWGEVRILHASDVKADARFGEAISISGDTAVVGAQVAFSDGIATGAAYIFSMNEDGAYMWGEVKKIVSSDRQAIDFFGCAVAIDEGTILVGACGEDGGLGDPKPDSGAAYVFARNRGGADNWGEVQKLAGSDSEWYAEFGNAVAIDDQQALVGAWKENSSGFFPLKDLGAAYVFARNQGGLDQWSQVKRLVSSDIAAEDYFGGSVAISGSYALVGAQYEDGGPRNPHNNAGAAYVFHRNAGGVDNWGEIRKLIYSNIQASGRFGVSVTIDDEVLAVGACMAGTGGLRYIFQLDPLYLYLPVVKR